MELVVDFFRVIVRVVVRVIVYFSASQRRKLSNSGQIGELLGYHEKVYANPLFQAFLGKLRVLRTLRNIHLFLEVRVHDLGIFSPLKFPISNLGYRGREDYDLADCSFKTFHAGRYNRCYTQIRAFLVLKLVFD